MYNAADVKGEGRLTVEQVVKIFASEDVTGEKMGLICLQAEHFDCTRDFMNNFVRAALLSCCRARQVMAHEKSLYTVDKTEVSASRV